MAVQEAERVVSSINSKEELYDLMYQIYLLYNIKMGKIDADSGKKFPLREAKARLANV